MRKKNQICVVWITAPSKKEGEKIASALLKGKMAACVNIIPGVRSHYWWDGKIESAREVLLMVKTIFPKASAIVSWIQKNHPYSVAEVLAVPVEIGNPPYMKWVKESLT